MSNSSSDNAIVFQDQEVRHRGIGESLLLGVSAGLRLGMMRDVRNTYSSGYSCCACTTTGKESVSIAPEQGYGTHRMATVVFWHVPLRF